MASKYIKGITIEIAGDTQKLTKALEGVNKQSRELQGELRQVERLLKLDPTNTELLEQKQKLLAKSIETTKEKLDTLKEAERQVQAQFEKGEIGEEQYRAIQREVIATEQNLQKLEQRLKETNNAWKTAAENLEKFGKKATDAGKNMTTKVTLPILGAGAAAVKVGADFEAAMSEVQAISGATGDELAALEEKAKEMGATTKFSATESAEALKYMSMAGWNTQQMLDGLEGVMNLAAASGEDLATVSDIVTDAMTAFGMKASESSKFADLLAKTSSSANTNVSMLGESFKYVAPIFGSLGYSAEDAALALGLMANAGIKSSQAGTTLRGAITRLAKPTDDAAALLEQLNIKITDAEGNMLPFSNVMDQLRDSFSGLTAEQQAQYAATIFGQEAMSGMLAIINASEQDYQKLAQAVSNYDGAAKKMADTMQNNLQGQLTILKSQLEGVAIQISEVLIPIVSKIVDKISEWVSWFSGLDESTQKIILAVAGLVAAIGPLLIVVGKISLGISSIITLFGGFTAASGAAAAAATGATAATGGLGAALTALTGPVGIIIAAIAGLIAIIVALWKNNEEFRENVGIIWEQIKEIFNTALNAIKELVTTIYNAIKDFWQQNNEEIRSITDTIWNAIQEIFNTILTIIQGLLDTFIGLFTGNWEQFGQGLQTIWQGVWNGIQTIFETVKTVIENLVQIFINFISSKWEGFGNTLQFVWDTVWNTIQNIIDSITTIIQGIVQTFIGLFTGDWEKFSDGIQTIWQGMWDYIKAIVEGAWDLLSGAFGGLWDNISGWFEDLIDDAFDWGKNMIDGFIDGIKSMIRNVKNTVKDVVNTVSDYIGFHSPAKKGEGRYIVDWGQNMIEGFMEGIQKALPDLQASVSNVTPVIKNEIATSEIDYSKIPASSRNIELHLHIGTFIGDEYGMKQLERRLRDIRISENARLGEA